MLSPAPPGHNIETDNKHSPGQHDITVPPVCRLTSLQRTASVETSPKFYPKVSGYWYLVFIKKKKKRRPVSSSVDFFHHKPFPSSRSFEVNASHLSGSPSPPACRSLRKWDLWVCLTCNLTLSLWIKRTWCRVQGGPWVLRRDTYSHTGMRNAP